MEDDKDEEDENGGKRLTWATDVHSDSNFMRCGSLQSVPFLEFEIMWGEQTDRSP